MFFVNLCLITLSKLYKNRRPYFLRMIFLASLKSRRTVSILRAERETILIKKSNGELVPATWTASRSPRGLNSSNLPLMEVRAFLLYPPRIAGQDPPYASDQEHLAKCGCSQLGLNSHFFSTANPSTDPTKVNITYTLRMELRCIEVQQNLQHQSTGIEGKHQKR